ncbi:MAG: GtrA family protein [Magnetococcales bacterium]|nr:GtrA family protein [Magnetococcales bacterium]
MPPPDTDTTAPPTPLPFWRSFTRSQIASVAGTAGDYLLSLILFHGLMTPDTVATALGSTLGAVTIFLLGRNWSFKGRHHSVTGQAVRYVLVVITVGIGLNTWLVHLALTWGELPYLWARVIVTIFLGVFINFPLYRYVVFR